MKKIIVLLLATGVHLASAKETWETSDQYGKPLTSIASIPYRGGGGSEGSVHFFYDIDLGYAAMSATGATAFHQGTFMYGGDLGIRINVASKSSDAANHISIAVGGYEANFQSFHSSTARALLSYTHFSRFINSEDAGLFWQAGLQPTYLYTVTDKNANDMSNHVNRLFFEPMVSFGIHMHISFVSRRTGNELAAARAFVGPVFSYGIGNLSKDSGETIHPGYKIAMRWSYVF